MPSLTKNTTSGVSRPASCEISTRGSTHHDSGDHSGIVAVSPAFRRLRHLPCHRPSRSAGMVFVEQAHLLARHRRIGDHHRVVAGGRLLRAAPEREIHSFAYGKRRSRSGALRVTFALNHDSARALLERKPLRRVLAL